ncbi:tannase and feruloyl esterase-domain-containing protein [Annulohypoxylon truncatum]|uniref:tannase and feruloyl esterase-domain-containing protein n=1 Tax=Annulohypoxylon truncatum TaxID=327061 RepID=UPI0020089E50|nr:tannase and feruloyl esterase-domain-containing protein [Annulohypoxylon truncatum]KAI1209571.1 tannase and feruloyl esterase-domain-containing protein [Annulohypoxylon truncatum]
MPIPLLMPSIVRGSGSTSFLDNLNRQLSLVNNPLSRNAIILSAVPVYTNSSYGDIEVLQGLPPTILTGRPELCAIQVNMISSESSSYIFALFLPSEWNSRFLTVGRAGTGGYINYFDSYNAPEKEIDWGWRAIHGSVGLAKQSIKTYYGKDAQYFYYTDCSTGGPQGLEEAQINADSFDGILVGGPAWWVTHLVDVVIRIQQGYHPPNNTRSIPAELFPLIALTVIEQCDEVDSVKDGIVSSPENCHPDFEVLNCKNPPNSSANASACLMASQLESLQEIYSDYYVGSELAYQGLELSSELGSSTNILPLEPLSFGLDFLR